MKMKKCMKIILVIIGLVVLLFVIDMVCIFTINKPLLAVKLKTPYVYSGLFYNVYNCPEYSIPQIKFKGIKFSCAGGKEDLIVKEIVDKTKDIKNFSCAEALEGFYSDDEYIYYWSCIKNKYMIVRYKNGYEETVKEVLKYGTITISDLDKYNINYLKYEK